jgi:PAP2 superfamily
MKQAPSRPIQAILVSVLAACAALFATRRGFYVEALVDPFFGLALASILILHLRIRPRWTDASIVGLLTLALAFVDFRVFHYPARLSAWFSFVGISSLLVLGAACARANQKDRRLLAYAWFPAVAFLISEWFAPAMLGWIQAAHPKTLDLYLLSFDASLHIQLSFLFGQLLASWPWLYKVSLFFYVGMPIPITLVYGGRLARFGSQAFSSMLAFLITGPAGILFYSIFPACGPAHVAHGYFPFHPLSISQTARLLLEPIPITSARNAIPSLHMAWTLLAWWYSRGLSWSERSIAFVFLAFTVLATLGIGEHYFVDLVVAFPFALMIEAICAYQLSWTDSRRLAAAGLGLGGVLLWLLFLRFANRLSWTSPVVPWVLVIATIALVQIRHSELQHAVARDEEGRHREAVLVAEVN